MNESCLATQVKTHAVTNSQGGNKLAITKSSDGACLQPITVRQMCKQAPSAFQSNWPNSKPSFTLEQWDAAQ